MIGDDGQVLWSDAGVSPVALADSRARWEAIWRLREQLVEIAHSHPVGPLAFSQEDETTMAALARALARDAALLGRRAGRHAGRGSTAPISASPSEPPVGGAAAAGIGHAGHDTEKREREVNT